MVLGPDGWGCCLFCCFCFSVVVATSLPKTNTKLTLRKIHLKEQHHDIHQTLSPTPPCQTPGIVKFDIPAPKISSFHGQFFLRHFQTPQSLVTLSS